MLFSTPQCFVSFAIVVAVFYSLPRRARIPFLLLASYFFYASWNWKFVPLLLTLTVIDFFAAQWIEAKQGIKRHGALVMSLVANLGFLGFFKYYNFAARTAGSIL